jgi:guanosine-3',5'-bis(diphosphate) 3'-pyrophosphohydrolase
VGEVDDVDVLVAAILHDTLEDTKTEPEEIIDAFGSTVNDMVLEVTDDKTLDKQERKKLQVEKAPQLSRGAKLIKLADKISNVREIGYDPPRDWDVKRRQKYFGWAREVVDALGQVNTNLEKRFDETLEESGRLLAEEAARDD